MERQAKDGTIYQKVGPDEWSPVTRTAKDGTVYTKVGADQWSPQQKTAESDDSGGVLGAVAAVGEAVDSYTGAPIRAGIKAAQKGENPLKAAWNQVGDSKSAPSGKDIAAATGLSTKPLTTSGDQKRKDFISAHQYDPGFKHLLEQAEASGQFQDTEGASPAGIAGIGIDMAADPTVVVPAGLLTKGARSAAKGAKAVAAAKKGNVIERTANRLSKFAEKTAVNATGATGKQATTFADNAGRELLDRRIVRFGDSQERIAKRASDAVDAANKQIDEALSGLDKAGAKVEAKQIHEAIEAKIKELKGDPSQADVVNLLEKELDHLKNATDARGSTDFALSEAEKIKRGYNKKAGNWADPEKGAAGKATYQVYREAVEDAAKTVDPGTAAIFEEGKKSHGLLRPIEEAAERRAATTSQSPAGGLLDVATAGAGLATGGPGGAVAAPIARRLLAPRVSSSVAVASDKAAKYLRKLGPLADLEKKKPAVFSSIANQLSLSVERSGKAGRAADNKDEPFKGPTKWAADGAAKVIESGADENIIAAAVKTEKGRELLIKASDLKPNSKAMTDIIGRLKKEFAPGGGKS